MNQKLTAIGMGLLLGFSACTDDLPTEPPVFENPGSFSEIGEITLSGGEGAAEISTYDHKTKRLFIVNNAGTSRIDVVDLKKPSSPVFHKSIDISQYGGGVNSLAAKNGILAAAVEADNKQDNGKVVLFDLKSFGLIKEITVGTLPDMVTFSPDGAFILSANEGEPNNDYTVDPEGTVSIISVKDGYSVNTLNFSAFNNQVTALKEKGLRVFGPNATLAQDVEPEYITVSDDSKTAWVSLQENNAIAKIDLVSQTISEILPLGFKDYNMPGNEIDVSDKDNDIRLANWPVKGMYQPDALAAFSVGGVNYVISANEGDAREYDAFEEEARVKKLSLDPVIFPNAAALQKDEMLGRLKVTGTLGDKDGDGVYEELYSFGARSFSIWNGHTGEQVYDSGSELERELIKASLYPDDRSDDKGIEPEGVATGEISGRTIAFIGAERADAVLIYDVTRPKNPEFLQVLKTGDAPEGILFIPAKESPNKNSLLVVSSEADGVVKIYQTGTF